MSETSRRRMMLIEFNELSPTLIEKFVARGELPAFRQFRETSVVFTTDAGEDPPHLEPWIQWPTVHSGVPFAQHRIFRLGDGRRHLAHPLVGDVLSDGGVPVGLFSPMNLNYGDVNGYSVPDPWDPEGRVVPPSLLPYWRVVSRAVQESSRDGALSIPDLMAFGTFLLRHGLRPSTARSVLGQLLAELWSKGVGWRRASVLDDIQYDVFRYLNQRHGVRFASFFSNSTAHYQHYHWRNMDPSEFDLPPNADDHPSLDDAILHGYRKMDRLLSRFMADEPDALLVLCTALSQQPWTDTRKVLLRPRSFQALMQFARVDVPDEAIKPVMSEEFRIELYSEAEASAVRASLLGLHVGDDALLNVKQTGDTLLVKCDLTDVEAYELTAVHTADGAQRPVKELFYQIHTMRSGRHHRAGALWFRTGLPEVVDDVVPLTAIAPTILSYFGVAVPAHMTAPALHIGPIRIGPRA